MDKIMKRVFDGDKAALKNLFVSEKVDRVIGDDGLFLPYYSLDNIVPQAAFRDVIYVLACPFCLRREDFDSFRTLVERGAIIPALSAPYSEYDEGISNFLYSHDHISSYEYRAFRYLSVLGLSRNEGILCRHCVGKWEKSANRLIAKYDDLKVHDRSVKKILSCAHPYINPDFEILDEFKLALKSRDDDRITRTLEVAQIIYALRSAQAFSSSFLINDTAISGLPLGVNEGLDEARHLTDRLQKDISDGLGLRIPVDIPLEEYLEIARDFRPQIKRTISKIIKDSGKGGKSSRETTINGQIMKMNSEIERIKGSARGQFLSAAVEFYGRNSTVINASLVAGAFGMAGHLAGCGPMASVAASSAGAGTTIVRGVAKKQQWIASGPATERFAETIRTSIQPHLDGVIAAYLGVSQPAVTVMSVRRGIDRRVNKAISRPQPKSAAKPAPRKSRSPSSRRPSQTQQ